MEIINYDIDKSLDTINRKRQNPMQVRLLQVSYHFIAKMISKKLAYQEILFENLEQYIEHLKSNRNFPAHLMIRELFRNNKERLQENLTEVLSGLVSNIENKKFNSFTRVQILDTLKVFLAYKNDMLVKN
jgi:hypothetical protein